MLVCLAAAGEPGLECGRIFAYIVKHSRRTRSVAKAEDLSRTGSPFSRPRSVLRYRLHASII